MNIQEEKMDDKFKLQLSAFGRIQCEYKKLCDLCKQNVDTLDLDFLDYDVTVLAYEMLITNYIFVLIGNNKSTDKISLFFEIDSKNSIVDFQNTYKNEYKTLLELRNTFFAHIDPNISTQSQINMEFALVCINFIKELICQKKINSGSIQKDK